MLVQIVLFDGFDLMDALAPYEVFCAAEMFSGGAISAELVTAEGARMVSSGISGLQIASSGKIDVERAAILLVPGASGALSGDSPDSVPSILARAMRTELTNFIRQAFKKTNTIVATVCGGSILLAMGGLLEGRHAVTNHLGMDVLGATGAIPVTARVVDDGNLVSGGGVTSGLDVALYLVERELGPRIANSVEKLFEYERRGTVWRERGLAPVADHIKTFSSVEPTLNQPLDDPLQAEGKDSTGLIFDGIWNTEISTPMGKLCTKFDITTLNGKIRGVARQGDDVVEFIDPIIAGKRLTWLQRVTKPIRLNLKFEVTVDGNIMMGTAKAGLLPASKVKGQRVEL
jgi:putative intracellular protease/amidase